MAPTLVCCAAPIGYGPATKLATLAGALRGHGLRPVFLGEGSALEAARRSTVFDDVLTGPGDAPAVRAAIDASAGLLSLMEREHLAVAQRRGRPTFVVDSLLWMRDHVPPAFRAATRYWAQDFVGVRGRAAGLATVIGPVVPPTAAPRVHGAGLVIALGGTASPFGDAAADGAWLDLLVEAVVDAGLVASFAGRAVCMASEPCRARLAARHAGRGITFTSLAPAAAARLLASAAFVLAAPGLTTALECFQLGVPTGFLPPLGYSQWLILEALRAQGLAPHAFHWADRLPPESIVVGMPEAGRTERVRALVRPRLHDAETRRGLRAALRAMCEGDLAALAARQHAFFAALGPNAVGAIARDIAALCADGGRA
ncbi:MAG: hypothetical protein KIT14_11540 [bacterium]|nr:hypothetical protein [bacterium]